MEAKEAALRAEYQDLQNRLKDPGIFSTADFPKLARRQSKLESTLALFDEYHTLQTANKQAHELIGHGDAEMSELANSELSDLEPKIALNEERLREELTPKDPNDEKDVVIEVRAAAGGDESDRKSVV